MKLLPWVWECILCIWQPVCYWICVVMYSRVFFQRSEEWIFDAEALVPLQSSRNAFSLPPDFECPPLPAPFLSEEDLRRPLPTPYSRRHQADFVIQMTEDPPPLDTISSKSWKHYFFVVIPIVLVVIVFYFFFYWFPFFLLNSAVLLWYPSVFSDMNTTPGLLLYWPFW